MQCSTMSSNIIIVCHDSSAAAILERALGDLFYCRLFPNPAQAIDYINNNDQIDAIIVSGSEEIGVNAIFDVAVAKDDNIPCFNITDCQTISNENSIISLPKSEANLLPSMLSLALRMPPVSSQKSDELVQGDLFSQLSMLEIAIDKDGIIECVNSYAKYVFGVTTEELIGNSIFKYIFPEDRRATKTHLSSVIDGQRGMKHLVRFKYNDGSLRWGEGCFFRGGVSNGSRRFKAIYRDITREKAFSNNLNQTNRRLQMLMENSPNMVFELDCNFKVRELNAAARNCFDIGKITNRSNIYYPDLFAIKSRGQVRDALGENLDGKISMLLAEVVDKKGQTLLFDLVLSPVKNSDGNVIAILASSWDVSQREYRQHKSQKDIKAKDRLAQESDILRQISLSAGSGIDIKPRRVLEKTVGLVCDYLSSYFVVGYHFDEYHMASRVSCVGDLDEQTLDGIDCFVNHPKVVNVIKTIKAPKVISRSQDVALHEFDSYFSSTPVSTALVAPLTNGDVCYGILIIGFENSRIKSHVLDFLSSLGQCAALAIGNSICYETLSDDIKRRMLQIDDADILDEDALIDVNTHKSLELIIRAGVDFAKAQGGIIMLLDSQRQRLGGIVGVGVESIDIANLRVSSDSIAWECVRSKETVFCDDISRGNSCHTDVLYELCKKTIQCLPILSKGEILGVFLLVDPIVGCQECHLSVLETFSTMIVGAIHKSCLRNKAAQLDQKLEDIVSVSKKGFSKSTIKTLLSEVCASVLDSVKVDIASIVLFNDDGNELVASVYVDEQMPEADKLTCHGILESLNDATEDAVKRGKSVVVRDVILSGGKYISCCVTPILYESQALGVIVVCYYESKNFSDNNISLLEYLSDKAALTITNVNLQRVLNESENLRECLLESMNDAVICFDWFGTIDTLNTSAEELFGLRISECGGKKYSDIFGKSNLISDVVGKWLKTRSSNDALEGEISINNKESYIAIESSNVVLNQLPCLLLTVKDLSQQRRINESLEHAVGLGSVGKIATQIAHEISNPLTFISSQIQRMVENDIAAQPADLEKLLVHIDRISTLIRKISVHGRKSPLVTKPEAIAPIVEDILELVQFTKPFEGIEINCDIDKDLPLMNVDKNKIFQVLLNLLINAADACEKEGRIVVGAKRKTVSKDSGRDCSGNYVVVSVKDNGTGIESEVVEKMFEPFYTTKPAGKGTGLGLAVTLGIINKHKGWINVKTELGKGSEMLVYLPSAEGAIKTVHRAIDEVRVKDNMHDRIIGV